MLGHAGQVAHHLLGGRLGVVDEHIQADHRVVAALQALEVGGGEAQLLGIDSGGAGAPFGLGNHRLREVAGGHRACPQLGQGQAEAAHPTAGIAETSLGQVALLLQPGQHLIHRLLVADADVALDLVHLLAIAVNAVPAFEAGALEVSLHFRLLGLLGINLLDINLLGIGRLGWRGHLVAGRGLPRCGVVQFGGHGWSRDGPLILGAASGRHEGLGMGLAPAQLALHLLAHQGAVFEEVLVEQAHPEHLIEQLGAIAQGVE